MGRLIDLTGPRGVIDLGILLQATVESVIRSRRSRRHRVEILNNIEAEIQRLTQREGREGNDIPLWRSSENRFKSPSHPKTHGTLQDKLIPMSTGTKGCGFLMRHISTHSSRG